MYCAISRSCNYSAQSWDSENAQHNLEIVQILRLRGTYICILYLHMHMYLISSHLHASLTHIPHTHILPFPTPPHIPTHTPLRTPTHTHTPHTPSGLVSTRRVRTSRPTHSRRARSGNRSDTVVCKSRRSVFFHLICYIFS